MAKAIAIPPGTVFGRLTVIEPVRTPNGRRGMLCRCECGKVRVADNANLRSGHTKSCGCFSREIVPENARIRGEIPLFGKQARGRVAFVDDGDYDFAMQYRWWVYETPRGPGRKPSGPYAQTWLPGPGDGSRGRNIFMHVLLMGHTGIDHANGNGLDNRRKNLRDATDSQNKANNDRYYGSSGFKGVYWRKREGRWHAMIRVNGRGITLGYFQDEIQAARAYDDAALEAWGEFARLNFPAA